MLHVRQWGTNTLTTTQPSTIISNSIVKRAHKVGHAIIAIAHLNLIKFIHDRNQHNKTAPFCDKFFSKINIEDFPLGCERVDSNHRPRGYEPRELPTAPLRHMDPGTRRSPEYEHPYYR